MIIHSQLTTPDGTVLVSKHRHDFVSHKDKNGKTYFLDGGTEYIRSSNNGDEEFLTITDKSPHEQIREYLSWGTYGKSGNEPFHKILLKNLSDEHIQAIIDWVDNTNPTLPILKAEQQYREKYETNTTNKNRYNS